MYLCRTDSHVIASSRCNPLRSSICRSHFSCARPHPTLQAPKTCESKHYYHFLGKYTTKPSACKTIKTNGFFLFLLLVRERKLAQAGSAGRSFVDHWSVRLAPEGRAEDHRFQGLVDRLPRNTEQDSLSKKSTQRLEC
jgi:hypothetical protein